jgi:hypothetical protein
MVNNYTNAIKKVLQVYNKAGFCVIEIRSDNKFQPLKDTLFNKFEILLNLLNLKEHVAEAEWHSNANYIINH